MHFLQCDLCRNCPTKWSKKTNLWFSLPQTGPEEPPGSQAYPGFQETTPGPFQTGQTCCLSVPYSILVPSLWLYRQDRFDIHPQRLSKVVCHAGRATFCLSSRLESFLCMSHISLSGVMDHHIFIILFVYNVYVGILLAILNIFCCLYNQCNVSSSVPMKQQWETR